MYKELDVVKLIRDVANLKKGELGTIIVQMDDNSYEIEFVYETGYEKATLTLEAEKDFILYKAI